MTAQGTAVSNDNGQIVTQFIPTTMLVHAEYNPRKINHSEFEQLKKNITKDPGFLFQRPCLVNRRDEKLVVYAGNQRLKAAKALGWEAVPCIVTEISIELEKQRNLLDNKSAGEFDNVLLMQGFGADVLTDIGFDVAALSGLAAEEGKMFAPGELENQGRLDVKKPVTCPKCGESFVAA